MASQLHFPRVDDDQLGAFSGRSLDGHAHHVLLFGKIGVDHQDAASLFQLPDGIGGGGVPQSSFQPNGQFRLGVGGLVHVVGVHHRPGKFLGQVMLLVGAVGRGEDGKGVASVIRQPAGDVIQRLVPGGLPQLSLPADQGLTQPACTIHEL